MLFLPSAYSLASPKIFDRRALHQRPDDLQIAQVGDIIISLSGCTGSKCWINKAMGEGRWNTIVFFTSDNGLVVKRAKGV